MSPTGQNIAASDKPLSRKRKKDLDRMLEKIMEFLAMPQGAEISQRLEDLVKRIDDRRAAAKPLLSDKEERALRFVQKQLRTGRSPSVREVARALGLRSSRSGFLVMAGLISKGVLRRSHGGGIMLAGDLWI